MRASTAVSLLLGLNCSSLQTRSIAISGTDGGNHSLSVLNFIVFMLSIMVTANSLSSDPMSSFVGRLVNDNIFYNWLMVELPGNIGL